MKEHIVHQQSKRQLMKDRQRILTRYGVCSSDELRKLIERGELPEHPTWEDYIELINIEEGLDNITDNAHSFG